MGRGSGHSPGEMAQGLPISMGIDAGLDAARDRL